MNVFLKIFLSMSFSGGLLILALFWGKQFLKNKVSRQWQYYIWLIAILRLLLPFGPETSFMGKTYQAVEEAIYQAASLPQQQPPLNPSADVLSPTANLGADNENRNQPAQDLTATHPLQNIVSLLINHTWLIWLVIALGMLIRKVTIYQDFLQYINAGLTPVSDIGILNRLSIVAEKAGIKKPIELYINPLISSPLMIGFFHPYIVFPSDNISEKDFQYIALHELMHYKRGDIFYKWLVQITVCLHWFNPLVHLMSREITKACEFSCDEAVLAKIGYDNAQDYGKTLLDAMAAVGRYKEHLGAVTLSGNKQFLKERLGAIMSSKKQSKAAKFLTAALTLCMIFATSFIGVYTMETSAGNARAASLPATSMAFMDGTGNNIIHVTRKDSNAMGIYTSDSFNTLTPNISDSIFAPDNHPEKTSVSSAKIEQYYKDNSLPLFEIAFSRLDENAQKTWLEKLYADNEITFFSVAVHGLDTNSSLFSTFSEKAYDDEETAFFSILTDCMDKAKLDSWLDRALEDGKWAFQSILFDKLEQGDEFDELKDKYEKEQEEIQKAKYQEAGVTMDGKNYYYQGQLVNIFLDIRANKSCYTLNMNPAGSINIKVIRDADDNIAGVSYMTEAEATELLNDTCDPDEA